ncbi:3D domain-containing protein [Paenibacillus koleovorans]|uniref:3D domain-containing protein n=1 Tax=Paenibacillus koleovorans TaxID=121608 RepID=UPI000FD860A1|nr:3D domain-containing protein [Paenibacillus koleovorans]
MHSSTMSLFRWLSVTVTVALILAFIDNGSTAESQDSYAAQTTTAAPEPQPAGGSVRTDRDIVRDRLAQIRSPQELMEKNKSEPWLHTDVSQFKQVDVVATGYYAGVESTGKRSGHPAYGITFSGVKARHGILSTIAADPKVFPLGTILYIPGYGYGIVADTGSAIKGKKIDLFYDNKEQIYREWGKRNVSVYIVQTGTGKVSEQTLRQWNDIIAAIVAEEELPFPL